VADDMTTYEIQIRVRVNLTPAPEQVKMEIEDLLPVIKKAFTPTSGTGIIQCEMDEGSIRIRKL
jgi:hypothetical protein